jgi:DHA1 family tetracycline resistance protein-like MFS transporter
MTDADPPRTSRRATGFVFVTVVLDTLAMGLIVPVLPRLILGLGGHGLANTAVIFGVLATVFAVMQFGASAVQGALSDRFGRRPVILISNIGLGLDYLIMAMAPNLVWLFAGRLLSGVAAGSGPAAYAYMADVTPPDRRAASFGLLFAAQALGAAMGPALGGLVANIDLRAPFWVAAGLSLANALYGGFVLPESLPRSRRAPLRWSQLNPIGALLWLVRAYPGVAPMVVVAVLLSLASQGVNNVAVVYALYRYNWGPAQIGLLLTAFGVASLGVQGGLVSLAAKRFGERGAMVCGLALTTLGLVMFGLAKTGLVFSLAVPLLALGAISGPMMGSIFSTAVGSDEQGRLQGAWSSINSMMGLLAPVLFTFIFARSITGGVTPIPGAAFFIGAAMVALAAAISALLKRT